MLHGSRWGSYPDAIYNCGAPAKGYPKKAGSRQLGEKWPKAKEVLKKVNFTNAQIAVAVAMVDVEDMTAEDAAAKWVKENEATWKTWLQQSELS